MHYSDTIGEYDTFASYVAIAEIVQRIFVDNY